MPILLLAGASLKLQRNPGALRQTPNRFGKIDAFILLHEREDVPAFVAAEAFEYLQVRIDVEAWRLLLVERAEGLKVRARTLQRHIGADNVYYVAGGADLFERRGRKQAGHQSIRFGSKLGRSMLARNL